MLRVIAAIAAITTIFLLSPERDRSRPDQRMAAPALDNPSAQPFASLLQKGIAAMPAEAVEAAIAAGGAKVARDGLDQAHRIVGRQGGTGVSPAARP